MNSLSPASISRRTRRLATLAVAVIAAAIGGWLLWTRLRGGDSSLTLTSAPAVRTDVVQQVTATGTLQPVVTVQVGSQVGGKIIELGADYNSQVKAGQVIARIDPEPFKNAITQARARLRSAEASVARTRALATKARIDHERLAKLLAGQLVAAADVDA
ncbi:MAG TPA: biotin/lipoyl-binding protein, partial [Kofleriaceae bacterium]|nr:biotin/lipoyl-binding protein [Kofleriaceae bacterium]